jgi:class 3 adenylate cyclase
MSVLISFQHRPITGLHKYNPMRIALSLLAGLIAIVPAVTSMLLEDGVPPHQGRLFGVTELILSAATTALVARNRSASYGKRGNELTRHAISLGTAGILALSYMFLYNTYVIEHPLYGEKLLFPLWSGGRLLQMIQRSGSRYGAVEKYGLAAVFDATNEMSGSAYAITLLLFLILFASPVAIACVTVVRIAFRPTHDSDLTGYSALSLAPGTETSALEEWTGGRRASLAIVFTDVLGSSALSRKLGDERMDGIRFDHFVQGRKVAAVYGGRVIKTLGDGLMVVFRSVDAALDFALTFRDHPGSSEISIRSGIHIGPIVIKDNDVFGTHVDLAARVVGMQTAGSIWLSNEARSHLNDQRPARFDNLKWIPHNVSPKGFGESVFWELSKAR